MLRPRRFFDLVLTPETPINTVSEVINLSLIRLRASLTLERILGLKNLRLKLKKLSRLPSRPRHLRYLRLARKKRKTFATVAGNKGSKS